jgi:glycerol-3-phosphate acyltransferase PlsY
MLAYAFPVGAACCVAWLIGALLTRISSMGALTSAAASSIILLFLNAQSALLMSLLLTILIFYRHKENILRMRTGTEPRIGQKNK